VSLFQYLFHLGAVCAVCVVLAPTLSFGAFFVIAFDGPNIESLPMPLDPTSPFEICVAKLVVGLSPSHRLSISKRAFSFITASEIAFWFASYSFLAADSVSAVSSVPVVLPDGALIVPGASNFLLPLSTSTNSPPSDLSQNPTLPSKLSITSLSVGCVVACSFHRSQLQILC
jgi:hypothetical protein